MAQDGKSGWGGIGRALSNRNFAVYTAGSAVSLVGTWLQRATVGWLAWDLTRDPALVGLAVSVDIVPAALVSPIAGAIADRQRGLTFLTWLQVLSLLQAVALAILAHDGGLSFETLLILTAALGVLSGLHQPLRLSLVHLLVRPPDMAAAVALNAVIFNAARIVGPAAAGFVIHYLGPAIAFAFNAASFLAALAGLALIRLGAAAARHSGTALGAEIIAGYRYVLGHRDLGSTMALGLSAAFLVRPVLELLPAYVGQLFDGGPEDFGFMMTAVATGAMASALWMTWRGANEGLATVAAVSVVLASVALVTFASAESLWFATASALTIGFAMSLRGTSTQAQIQLMVDPAMRGRVLSFYTMIFNAGPALGALGLGLIAGWSGLRLPIYVVAALNLLMLGLIVGRRRDNG
jgi:MFS family permease